MLKEHKRSEMELAKRSLLFLSPLLLLVGAAGLGLFGIDVIDPVVWFFALLPTLLFGWWFGHRPLAKLKDANRRAMMNDLKLDKK